MSRIDEIEARLAAISTEMEQDGADLGALDKEIDSLIEERKTIADNAEKRREMADKVANNKTEPVEEGEEQNMSETRTFTPDTAEYRAAWLKQLQGKPLDEEERAAMTASAAIPTSTANKIFAEMREATPMLTLVTSLNIPGNVELPYESTVADANWVAMANSASDAADAIGAVTLSAYKLIKTVSIGADVARISIDAFEDWLVRRLVDKMQKAVDNAIVNGNNTNQPKGFSQELYDTVTTTLPAVNLVQVASNASIGWDNIMDLISLLPSAYDNKAAFAMSRKMLFGEVAKAKASTAGTPLFVMNPENGFIGRIMGYPVVVDDNIAAKDIYFGDFGGYVFNWASPIEVTSDDSVDFRYGNRCWRAIALADGELVDKRALVKLNHLTA